MLGDVGLSAPVRPDCGIFKRCGSSPVAGHGDFSVHGCEVLLLHSCVDVIKQDSLMFFALYVDGL